MMFALPSTKNLYPEKEQVEAIARSAQCNHAIAYEAGMWK
jgi:hypothetical protein